MDEQTLTGGPPEAPPAVPPDVPPRDTGGGRGEGPELRVVATYDQRDAARRAIEALSLRGVDGGRMHLVDVDPEAFDQPVEHADRRTDAAVTTVLGTGALLGIAWGAVVGVVLAGLAMFAWRGPVVETAMVALGGGLAGMMVGAAIGLVRFPVMSVAWGETSRPVHPGADTVLVVRLRRGQDPDPVRRVLAREGRSVSLVREDG